MTTPEIQAQSPPLDAPPADSETVRRPEPERTGPIRTGAPPKSAAEDPKGAGAPVSESVANAVRMGYEVITENIKQGRVAAERFRHGEYHMRDVPSDVDVLARRMLELARELSTTTFDVVERLLKETRAAEAPAKAPPFYANPASGAHKKAEEPKPQPGGDPVLMRVNCCFTGKRRAVLRSAALTRPLEPIFASEHLVAEPLKPAVGGRSLIDVSFEADKSGGGLIITIAIPDDQPAGVYSGLVSAPYQDWPLGVLAVEVLA